MSSLLDLLLCVLSSCHDSRARDDIDMSLFTQCQTVMIHHGQAPTLMTGGNPTCRGYGHQGGETAFQSCISHILCSVVTRFDGTVPTDHTLSRTTTRLTGQAFDSLRSSGVSFVVSSVVLATI